MTILSVRDLTVRLGERRVLDGVSLTVDCGETVGLIGPNGAGKTTLLRASAGLVDAEQGTISVRGTTLAAMDRRTRGRTIAYLPQDATCHWPLQVERLVALGRMPHLLPWQRPSGEHAAAIDAAMSRADVGYLAGRNVQALSGGERARVLLARALAVEPALLLADEPVAGLDPGHQLQMMAVFRQQARAGASVIVTLHDLSLAARFCDRVIMLCDGFVVADGCPDAVFAPDRLASVFHIHAKIGADEGRRYVVPLEFVRAGGQDVAAE